MRKIISATVTAVLIVGGCTQPPVGTTVVVTPGPGKTAASFKADEDACRQGATQATAGAANAANQVAVTGALAGLTGAVSGGNVAGDTATQALNTAQTSQVANGTLQQQFDEFYKNCMYGRGNLVAGMEPPPPPPPPAEPQYQGPVRDPLVMHVQQQLVRLGYLSGGADGIAGRKTASAITKYETDHGLSVDGVSSDDLLHALRADHANGSGNPAGWVMPPAAPNGGTPAPSN
jgi:hypothetical protein